MKRIMVPLRHQEAVTRLSRLSRDEVQQLNAAISASDGSSSAVQSLVSATTGEDAVPFEALVALNATRLTHGMSANAAAQQALTSLGEAGGVADLAPLLENPALVQLAKRSDLASATQRQLHLARVLTDVRPIFDEDAARDIEAVLITQTLQMIYLADGYFEEVYVSVDREDLMSLRDQIDRALIKFDTTNRFARAAGATVMSETEGEL